MALRIPLSPDQTLQTEFHEVERRLRALEKRTGVTVGSSIRVVNTSSGAGVPINLQPFLDRLTALEQQVNNLPTPVTNNFGGVGATSAAGLVPAPGVPEPPTGLSEHLILENGAWGYPFRGMIQRATVDSLQLSETLDILGSLSVSGGLAVDEITCRDVTVLGESDLLLTQRGGVWLSPTGAATATAWRAPYACTVVNVRGRRAGGTGATLNARRNGASTHLVSDLSLTVADTWKDGGAVQDTAYAVGDSLEFMLQSVAGGPTEVAIQVDFRRART
jgi:hypothetical protein